jgi:hypothetical protein
VFVLIGRRLSDKAGTALLVAFLVLPYINLAIIVKFRERYPSTIRLFPEWTFIWIPLLVIVTWFATEALGKRRRGLAPADAKAAPSAVGGMSPPGVRAGPNGSKPP